MSDKDFIKEIATEAGKLSLEYLGKAKVSSKGIKNIVTEADVAVENLIIKKIREKFPAHDIISEETDNRKTSDYVWYIDPIDGTNNYAHSDILFCVSIALAYKGVLQNACIYIPTIGELYYAERGKGAEMNGKRIAVSKTEKLRGAMIHAGISPLKNTIEDSLRIFRHFMLEAERARDYGFSAGQLAFLAAGRADGFVKVSQHPWDIAAGALLVQEAGGKVTDLFGDEIFLNFRKRYSIVASNSLLHSQIISELQKLNFREPEQEWFG